MGIAKLNTKKMVQIGIRVKDLDAAAKAWEKFLGVTPTIVTTDGYEITGAEYKGEPCYGLCKQALFDLENIQIELICPIGEGMSGWKEGMEQMPEGIHHIAFKTTDMDETIASCGEEGYPLLHKGRWVGETPGKYAYVDAREELKVILELLES